MGNEKQFGAVEDMFQFLIGRVKIQPEPYEPLVASWFQFLIGRVKMQPTRQWWGQCQCGFNSL